MIKKGIIIDTLRLSIERECSYNDERIDGMYYKVDGKDLIPIAYIYPIKQREAVQVALDKMKLAKDAYNKAESELFYRILPSLRG